MPDRYIDIIDLYEGRRAHALDEAIRAWKDANGIPEAREFLNYAKAFEEYLSGEVQSKVEDFRVGDSVRPIPGSGYRPGMRRTVKGAFADRLWIGTNVGGGDRIVPAGEWMRDDG